MSDSSYCYQTNMGYDIDDVLVYYNFSDAPIFKISLIFDMNYSLSVCSIPGVFFLAKAVTNNHILATESGR